MHVCSWWAERIPNETSGTKTVEMGRAEGKKSGGVVAEMHYQASLCMNFGLCLQ